MTEPEYRLLEGRARTALAEIELARGRPVDALAEAERALAIHRETSHRPGEAATLALLAEALHDRDRAAG